MTRDLLNLMREQKNVAFYCNDNEITIPTTGYAIFYNPTLCLTTEEIEKEIKKRGRDWGMLIRGNAVFVTDAFWDKYREEVVSVAEMFTSATALYNFKEGEWEGF